MLFGCPLILSPDPFGEEEAEPTDASATATTTTAAAAAAGGASSSSSVGGAGASPTSLEGLAALAEALRARNAGLVCLCDRALCEPGATAIPAAAAAAAAANTSGGGVGIGRKLSIEALYLLRAGGAGASLMVQRIAAADETVPVRVFCFFVFFRKFSK